MLPLVLNRFDTADIAIWYLFSTLIGMQLYFEVGFTPTFQRMFAFGMGGATKSQLSTIGNSTKPVAANTSKISENPNWETIEATYATTASIFRWIALATLILLSSMGTLLLIIPISACSQSQSIWTAWAILASTTSIMVFGKSYRCYLNGTNHIALQQRWIAGFGLLATLSNFLVLLFGGGLLELVISQQTWGVINLFRDRHLARNVMDGRLKHIRNSGIDPEVFQAAWPAAWRSGLGYILGRGLLSASSLLIAQIAATPILATYLLSINLINKVNQFSLAPFYSKLPVLAQKRAAGDVDALTSLSKRGMAFSYATFLIGFACLGIAGPRIVTLIGSNADFPTATFWTMIGVAFFLERFGSMHLQLYSTTNKIIWHWVTGGYAVIYLLVLIVFMKSLGVYAIPLAMMLGYLLFYVPVSVWYSHKSLGSNFWKFEKFAFIPACVCFLLCCSLIIAFEHFTTK